MKGTTTGDGIGEQAVDNQQLRTTATTVTTTTTTQDKDVGDSKHLTIRRMRDMDEEGQQGARRNEYEDKQDEDNEDEDEGQGRWRRQWRGTTKEQWNEQQLGKINLCKYLV